MYRQILCILGLALAAGCRPRSDAAPVPVVHLLRELDAAERRPPSGFLVTAHEKDGGARPAVVVPVPSRLTLPLPLPRRGVLRTALAVQSDDPAGAVRFRVGVSDHRVYENLDDIVVTADRPGWMELRTDLSAYAGFKWSLFYRPDAVTWRVVLAADTLGGPPVRGVWAAPEIVTDRAAAVEYVERRSRLQRSSILRSRSGRR